MSKWPRKLPSGVKWPICVGNYHFSEVSNVRSIYGKRKKAINILIKPSLSKTKGQQVTKSGKPECEINIFFRILEDSPFLDINWVTDP